MGAKLPKKIAGFRVPKAVRRSKSLRGILKSKATRAILAEVLVAAAGAAAVALTRTKAAKAASSLLGEADAEVDGGAEASRGPGDLIEKATGALADVAGDTVRSLLPAAIVQDSEKRPRYISKSSDLYSSRKSSKGGKARANRRKAERHV